MRPIAAAALWRISNPLTRCPGARVALSTVVSPTPMISRAQVSNGQSICAISRRSIRSILGGLPFFLQLEECLHDVMGNRRGHGTTATFGVFDDDGHGDLGRIHRCIRHEPGVVATVPRK